MSKFFILFLLVLSGNALASPDISVGTLYDYMSAEKTTLLKRIRNIGDETAFVKITLAEIVYDADGVPKERELPEEGVRQLVTSPSRLIIPAGGMQATRFIYMGERERERYFRVRFVPVKPQDEDLTELPPQQQISAGVSIMTGFGTILFVAPKETRYDTRIDRENGVLYVENRGNATVILDYLELCDKKETSCSQPEKMHLLPGVKKRVSEEATRMVRFELIEGKKSAFREFKL
ncbi:hypothetical protein WP3W19E03_32160 [Aeromonas veronii]|uniref:Molecular chaperone n=1 Tax=Aeromonas veronii TaxID=654 RepID=A0A6S5CKY5_AERVE|nr:MULTISPECIES: hypothetical protein [Aeromonas]BBR40691.1 hypothetical protein WP3W19E03_32160 [Aeromonas veronii]